MFLKFSEISVMFWFLWQTQLTMLKPRGSLIYETAHSNCFREVRRDFFIGVSAGSFIVVWKKGVSEASAH